MRKTVLIMFLLIVINSLDVSNVFASTTSAPPKIVSESAIVMEANTGGILFEKNASNQMHPASLTKIATAIYDIKIVK